MVMPGMRLHPQQWKMAVIWANISAFGQSKQLHSHFSEVVSILPSGAKPLLRLFHHTFLLLMARWTLLSNELFCF